MHYVRFKILTALNMKTSLPGCGTVCFDREVPKYWRNPLPPFSFFYLEDEAAPSSKMLVAV
jgi:hypothetical protein